MTSDILQENPSEAIQVFVIWFAVLGPDDLSQVDTSLIDDPRAVHYWDSDGEISAFLSENAEQVGLPEVDLFWDGYLLFGPSSEWEKFPTDLAGWGAPVVSTIDELMTEVDEIWARSQ